MKKCCSNILYSVTLPILAAIALCITVHNHAHGRAGDGSRCYRCHNFPSALCIQTLLVFVTAYVIVFW